MHKTICIQSFLTILCNMLPRLPPLLYKQNVGYPARVAHQAIHTATLHCFKELCPNDIEKEKRREAGSGKREAGSLPVQWPCRIWRSQLNFGPLTWWIEGFLFPSHKLGVTNSATNLLPILWFCTVIFFSMSSLIYLIFPHSSFFLGSVIFFPVLEHWLASPSLRRYGVYDFPFSLKQCSVDFWQKLPPIK